MTETTPMAARITVGALTLVFAILVAGVLITAEESAGDRTRASEGEGYVEEFLPLEDEGWGEGEASARRGDAGDGGGSVRPQALRAVEEAPAAPATPPTARRRARKAVAAAPGSPTVNVASIRPAAPADTPLAPAAGSRADGEWHRVVSGDTLRGIAERRYGRASAWNAIAKANPAVDPQRLKIGVRLRLPAAPSKGGALPSTERWREHTIAKGDSLSRLARRYLGNGNRWPILLRANRARLPDPNRLVPGQKILVPPR